MNKKIDEEVVAVLKEIIPSRFEEYIPLVRVEVETKFIKILKQWIDNGEVKQDKLLDEEYHPKMVLTLFNLIYQKWKGMGVEVNIEIDRRSLDLSVEIYHCLKPDLELLSKNYKKLRSSRGKTLDEKREFLVNTINELKGKGLYLKSMSSVMSEYETTLSYLETKVIDPYFVKELEALIIAMETSNADIIIDIGLEEEIFVYPVILDLFKDHFYMKLAFYAERGKVDRRIKNVRINPKTYMFPDEETLSAQFDYGKRDQLPSRLRCLYQEEFMFPFKSFRSLYRQIIKKNVRNNKKFAGRPFDKILPAPLRLYKYTLYWGNHNDYHDLQTKK